MNNNIVFLDIESVAGPDKPRPEDIKPPSNYTKPETILAYQLANAEEVWKKQALDSLKGEIYCIGYAPIGEEAIVVCGADELETMETFSNEMDELRGRWKENLKFVGWNILSFDIPFLWRKSLKYNLISLRNALPKENRNFVIDLMKVFATDFKDYVSLSNAAKFLGIEHNDKFSGKDVHDAWLRDDNGPIVQHCADDLKTVREIYNRIYSDVVKPVMLHELEGVKRNRLTSESL